MGGGLEVGLGAEGLDLVGELREEVGDLVEAVAVLPFDLAESLLAPGAEVGMPVPGGAFGAEDGGEDGVALLGVVDLDLGEAVVERGSWWSLPSRAMYSSATGRRVSVSSPNPVPGGGTKK